ncbi:twin-arginine translocation signal domain-containing protein, partial [Pseudoxanthomonas sp. SGD-10]
MERRNFLKAAAITGVAGISLSACTETQGQGE